MNGEHFPVKVYRERRSSVRAAVGKSAFILRLPTMVSQKEFRKHWRWFGNWVTNVLKENPKIRTRFIQKAYQTGDTITVGQKKYVLSIQQEDRKTHGAKLEGDTIYLKMSQLEKGAALQKSIKQLLSRVIAQDFLPSIKKRVNAINQKYFKNDVKSVRLKYNQSNWGSCSSKGNINLSTKLLFAPDDVIDYVIIHELAHFIEMNHSPRFWAIVAKVMPNYEEKEQWLKQNGHLCDF